MDQEIIDVTNSEPEFKKLKTLRITLQIFLTSKLYSSRAVCDTLAELSPYELTRYSSILKLNIWIKKAPLEVQTLDVSECYQDGTGNNFTTAFKLVSDCPFAKDRYSSMIKTELEFLADLY